MEKVNLTAIITTFNEEKNIEKVIRSVLFADEIIIVDSFSKDKTIEIAGKFDTSIIQHEYISGSKQKNWIIPQAKNKWILIVDADEMVTPELRSEIIEVLKNDPEEAGFWIYRTFYFMGKLIKHSGWRNDKVMRLFKRDYSRYNNKYVHEELTTDGKVGFLKNKLYHNTYISLDNYIEKLNRYATLQALDYDPIVGRITAYHLIIKPFYRFNKHYIIHAGFLDGFQGFVISIVSAYAVRMRYIKLWLLRKNQK